MSASDFTLYLFHISAPEPHILTAVKAKPINMLFRHLLWENKSAEHGKGVLIEGATLSYQKLGFSKKEDQETAVKLFKLTCGGMDWHSKQYNEVYLLTPAELEEG